MPEKAAYDGFFWHGEGLCRTREKGFSSTTHYLQGDCKERSAQFVELGSLSAHMYVVQ